MRAEHHQSCCFSWERSSNVNHVLVAEFPTITAGINKRVVQNWLYSFVQCRMTFGWTCPILHISHLRYLNTSARDGLFVHACFSFCMNNDQYWATSKGHCNKLLQVIPLLSTYQWWCIAADPLQMVRCYVGETIPAANVPVQYGPQNLTCIIQELWEISTG